MARIYSERWCYERSVANVGVLLLVDFACLQPFTNERIIGIAKNSTVLSEIEWPLLWPPTFTSWTYRGIMKKAELEGHSSVYDAAEDTIRAMCDSRQFPVVFSVCLDSFEHIVPTIQFRKKNGIVPDVPPLVPFKTICKYAPVLFEHDIIQALIEFIRSNRVLARHENDYQSAAELALKQEDLAWQVWNHLERHPGSGHHEIANGIRTGVVLVIEIIRTWEHLGVVDRLDEAGQTKFFFRSSLDSEVEGACHECGVRGKGRKELFYRPIRCKVCGHEGHYHIRFPRS